MTFDHLLQAGARRASSYYGRKPTADVFRFPLVPNQSSLGSFREFSRN